MRERGGRPTSHDAAALFFLRVQCGRRCATAQPTDLLADLPNPTLAGFNERFASKYSPLSRRRLLYLWESVYCAKRTQIDLLFFSLWIWALFLVVNFCCF